MFEILWPSGAPSVVFYKVWRLQEVPLLTAVRRRVGPLKQIKHSRIRRTEAGSLGGLEVTNVSRIVALGGSICRILRGLEAPGGSNL